jgi:hypothetical protein
MLYTSTRSEGRARHTSRHLQPALLRYCLLASETVLAHVSQVPFSLQQFGLKLCQRPTQKVQPCIISAKLFCPVILRLCARIWRSGQLARIRGLDRSGHVGRWTLRPLNGTPMVDLPTIVEPRRHRLGWVGFGMGASTR